jgi:hypothetical protein
LALVGLLGGLLLLGSCATVGSPGGGPEDRTPPALVAVAPDSGAVGLGGLRHLGLRVSEKMDPQPASSFLQLFPEVPVAQTKWHGRQEVGVFLEEPLPPDTVIVVEVTASLRDAHGVPMARSRSYPLATADALPDGMLSGRLVMAEEPLADGRVELYAWPPEGRSTFPLPPLRRAPTDTLGRWQLPWLPWPSGPYYLRAFADPNGDERVGENEARRLLAQPVSLDSLNQQRDLGITVLYDPQTPGRLITSVVGPPAWPGGVMGFTEKIAEEDTGWAPAPQKRRARGQLALTTDGESVFEQVGPGLVRVILFVDADQDSLLSLLPAVGAAAGEGPWFLEPYALLDSLHVEAGLDTTFTPPGFPASLTPWSPPKDEP